MLWKFSGQVSGKPQKVAKIPKCESFNRKFWKCLEENRMEAKFPVRNSRKFAYTENDVPFARYKSNHMVIRVRGPPSRNIQQRADKAVFI